LSSRKCLENGSVELRENGAGGHTGWGYVPSQPNEGRASACELVADFFVEEIGHELQGLLGFGELEVIPEGVRQGFEDDELGTIPGAEKRAMEEGGVAKEKVAGAGHEKTRWHVFQVGEIGRKDGIATVCLSGVFVGWRGVGILRLEGARETIESEELVRVGGAREVGEDGEEAEGGGLRKV
jgi:hypothetical protein